MRSFVRYKFWILSVLLAMSFPVADLAQAQPGITTQPASTTIFIGQNSSFSCTVTGAAPLWLQWFKDNIAIANATNSAYGQTNVQAARAGNYFLIASNASGSATSAVATLTVIGGEANFRLGGFTHRSRYKSSGGHLRGPSGGPAFNYSLLPPPPGGIAQTPLFFSHPN